MRFVRHARIYRGPLDAAPLAGVAFLLILFLLLTSLVYTPGALVRVAAAEPSAKGEALELTKSGAVVFRGTAYTNLGEARTVLRQEPIRRLNLIVDAGANPSLAKTVQSWFEVNLPSAKQLTGTDSPSVIVAVNFRGQYFFENRLMDENELKSALQSRLEAARRRSSDLTLTLAMDKDTTIEVFMHLSDLARAIGFKETVVGDRP